MTDDSTDITHLVVQNVHPDLMVLVAEFEQVFVPKFVTGNSPEGPFSSGFGPEAELQQVVTTSSTTHLVLSIAEYAIEQHENALTFDVRQLNHNEKVIVMVVEVAESASLGLP